MELTAVLRFASAIALGNGDTELAVSLYAATQGAGGQREQAFNRLFDLLAPDLEMLREMLGESFDKAWARGLAMSQGELRRLALETAEGAALVKGSK